jgi:hypothetical protein
MPKLPKIAESGCPAFTIPLGWAAFQFGLLAISAILAIPAFANDLVTDDQIGYISAHVHLSTQPGAGCIPASVCPWAEGDMTA